MTESRLENSKVSCARGIQIWKETWFLPRVFVPICGTRPPDHPHMATETRCHHNRKARICEAQAGVFAREGRDVRRGHRVQGGTTGPETSAHSLRALGTSPRLVQPFPPWHSCLSLGNPPSVTGTNTSLLYASFSTARFSLTRKDRLVFKGVQFLGKLL